MLWDIVKNKQQKETIRAIYYKDVANVLESIGLLETLQRGEFRCSICGEQITINNLRAIGKKSGEYLFCCEKELCIQKLASILRQVNTSG